MNIRSVILNGLNQDKIYEANYRSLFRHGLDIRLGDIFIIGRVALWSYFREQILQAGRVFPVIAHDQ